RVLAAQNACPKDAVDFVNVLKQSGARMEPTMVNFAGFHNSDKGAALFIFEIVSSDGVPPSALTIPRGDLLFGHFTNVTRAKRLISTTEDLVIELMTWGPAKQFYNFSHLF